MIQLNAENAESHTALDIVLLSKKEKYENFLRGVKCKRAKDVVHSDWLSKKRDTLMVVASLIATVAYQAAVSLPAGVWQDTRDGHRAGEAVMAYNDSHFYPKFVRANKLSFVASLSLILFLISDVPFKNRFYMWCLVLIMWLTITATAVTYGFSITVVTPEMDSVMAVLLVCHSVMLLKDVWDDWNRRSEAKENVNKFGHGDEINPSAQSEEGYNAYTLQKLPANHGNGDEQHEIQMVTDHI